MINPASFSGTQQHNLSTADLYFKRLLINTKKYVLLVRSYWWGTAEGLAQLWHLEMKQFSWSGKQTVSRILLGAALCTKTEENSAEWFVQLRATYKSIAHILLQLLIFKSYSMKQVARLKLKLELNRTHICTSVTHFTFW